MLKTHKRHGKDSKYTSAIDISITGGGTGSAVGRGEWRVAVLVALVFSLLVLVVSLLSFLYII